MSLKKFEDTIGKIFTSHQAELVEHVIEEILYDTVTVVIEHYKPDASGKLPTGVELAEKVKAFLGEQLKKNADASKPAETV